MNLRKYPPKTLQIAAEKSEILKDLITKMEQKRSKGRKDEKVEPNSLRTEYLKFMRLVWQQLPSQNLLQGVEHSYYCVEENGNAVGNQNVITLVSGIIHKCLFGDNGDKEPLVEFADYPQHSVTLLTKIGNNDDSPSFYIHHHKMNCQLFLKT